MKMKVDWKNEELIKKTVKESLTNTEVLKKLGINNGCGNNQTLLKYIKLYNIDVSHINGNAVRISKLRKTVESRTINNENYFINGVQRNNRNTKIRLLKNNLKEHKCNECGIGTEWNGKTLSLQLDHINGDSFDNRLNNLRFLCPNCHSQTLTFAGKKLVNKVEKKEIFNLEIFEKERKAPKKEEIQIYLNMNGINKSFKYFKMGQKSFELLCKHYQIDLNVFKNRKKIEWPSKDDVQKMLLSNTLVEVGKKLGLSDVAVKKYSIKNKLFLPTSINQGYWAKVKANILKKITFEDLIFEDDTYKLNPTFII